MGGINLTINLMGGLFHIAKGTFPDWDPYDAMASLQFVAHGCCGSEETDPASLELPHSGEAACREHGQHILVPDDWYG